MYDYTAANRDELSFSKGQLINILDKTNPDWWKGDVSGVTGLLPTNYVKMTTESDPSQQCEYTSSLFLPQQFLPVGQNISLIPFEGNPIITHTCCWNYCGCAVVEEK